MNFEGLRLLSREEAERPKILPREDGHAVSQALA